MTRHPTDQERLARLLRARHPAISIVTHEEREARRLVEESARGIGAHLWTWSLIEGVRDGLRPDSRPIDDTTNPAAGFYWLSSQDLPTMMLLFDAGAHAGDPHAMRSLRGLIARAAEIGGHVVLIDPTASLPLVVRDHATPFELSLPDDERIEAIIKDELKSLHRAKPIVVDLRAKTYRMIVKNLRGLAARQIAQVVRDVVAEDRVFDDTDLNDILAEKRRMVSAEGTLEYIQSPASLDDVGGLVHLKAWLAQRENAFDDEAAKFGLKPPRGVLMLGVQGAGKSLCAKAIATAWGRPLLRLDPGSLYDRYVGESEARLRKALDQAELMAPIVLWIDEIEKGFASAASQSTDGGLSQRMFGTLLTWMQDHEEPVFTVATANNIDALPPELLRKGRFDEIFFVDLPGHEAREKIFEIHLRKRHRDPMKFDLPALAEAAEGFSGAEIEQAVISAMHEAFTAHAEPTTESIVACLENSPPLSVTMAEKVAMLRAWAKNRCVPAG
ncbi:MAG: AAA family ATPase [Phycisphaeraceae bacterium]|nr:MAG: AAA family ATPase [Phycisphaeraceae bacterium]